MRPERIQQIWNDCSNVVCANGDSSHNVVATAILALGVMVDEAGQLHSSSMTELCKSIEHVGHEVERAVSKIGN